jgi:hypothetical protein
MSGRSVVILNTGIERQSAWSELPNCNKAENLSGVNHITESNYIFYFIFHFNNQFLFIFFKKISCGYLTSYLLHIRITFHQQLAYCPIHKFHCKLEEYLFSRRTPSYVYCLRVTTHFVLPINTPCLLPFGGVQWRKVPNAKQGSRNFRCGVGAFHKRFHVKKCTCLLSATCYVTLC